jgi:hypothetical protein
LKQFWAKAVSPGIKSFSSQFGRYFVPQLKFENMP